MAAFCGGGSLFVASDCQGWQSKGHGWPDASEKKRPAPAKSVNLAMILDSQRSENKTSKDTMAQAVRKSKNKALKPERSLWGNQLQLRLREGIFIFLCALAVFFLVSLISYSPMDPGWTHEALSEHIQNACGWVGAWFADISLVLLGYLAFALPVMLAYSGWTVFHDWREIAETHHYLLLVRVFGFLLICIAGTGLMHIHFPELGQTFPVRFRRCIRQ